MVDLRAQAFDVVCVIELGDDGLEEAFGAREIFKIERESRFIDPEVRTLDD